MSRKFSLGLAAILLLAGAAPAVAQSSQDTAQTAATSSDVRPGGAARAPTFQSFMRYQVADLMVSLGLSSSDETAPTRTASADEH